MNYYHLTIEERSCIRKYCVVSGQGKSAACFAALAERKTGYCIAIKISDRKAQTMENAAAAALEQFPPELVKTITCDRGSEFANWDSVEKRLLETGIHGKNQNTVQKFVYS